MDLAEGIINGHDLHLQLFVHLFPPPCANNFSFRNLLSSTLRSDGRTGAVLTEAPIVLLSAEQKVGDVLSSFTEREI